MATGKHTRRGFIKTLAAGSAIGALGACTVTTSGNVTTVTLDVARIKAYATAGINAVSTILSIGAVASAIGAPAIAIIESASAALESALNGFATVAGSNLSVSYDSTDVKSAVNSVLVDLQSVANKLSYAITHSVLAIPENIMNEVNTALDAVFTIVSVFEGILGYVGINKNGMTEEEALRFLKA